MEIPFVGGSYEGKSKNLNAQVCQNLYPVVDQLGGKSVLALYNVPGTKEYINLGGRYKVSLNGNLYFSHPIYGLYSTGYNYDGQLCLGDNTDRNIFTLINNDDWKQLNCGYTNNAYLIKADGTLWVAGANYYGQLGLGDTDNRLVLTQVGSAKWNYLDGGAEHLMAIKTDGTLWGTGRNQWSQLGLVWPWNEGILTQVGSDTWTQVACGYWHTLAIKSDGTLWATGCNNNGCLGFDINIYGNKLLVLTQVGSDTWTQVACGNDYSMAIKSDGTLWATGADTFGHLGLGDSGELWAFTQVGSDIWTQVDCFWHHTMAINEDGTLWGTGMNDKGELGLGVLNSTNVFLQVGSDTWKYVSCGDYHTMAIRNDDTLWATGENNNWYGQLGLGELTWTNVFLQVGTDKWKLVACGSYHTIALSTS